MLIVNFYSEITKFRDDTLKEFEEKILSTKNSIVTKLSFKNQGEIETFLDLKKVRVVVTADLPYKKHLR